MRFALDLLGKTPNVLKWLTQGQSGGDLALRLGMDGIGALGNAAATPGDWGDKGITFLTDLGMSSTAGLAAGRLPGGKNRALGTLYDMAGSMAGAYGSMPVSEKLLQAKDLATGGAGETPWQKMGREQQEQYAQQLEQEILAKYGLINPQSAHYLNPGVMGNGIA